MRKKIIYTASISLILVGGIIGIIHALKKEPEIQYMNASWSYNYTDIAEISQSSDIIALVKATGDKESYIENGIPYTKYKVNVISPIYGTEENEILTLLMTGGTDQNGLLIEITDDPLLRKNEEFLIFTQQNENGTLTVLGGPQGRLMHSNGKVNSLTPQNSYARTANPYSNIQITNANLDDIINEINTALNAKE